MAENKMKEAAKLLGIEIGKPFNIKGYMNNPCILTDEKITNKQEILIYSALFQLLTGELEIERPILDDIEKRYLENVLRPFKDRVVFIRKSKYFDYEYICYEVLPLAEKYGKLICNFPFFKKGTMYKGMKPSKEYSLEELGLFESDSDEDVG